MKDLIKQNYEVTRERGLITDHTSNLEFESKLLEEMCEVTETKLIPHLALELADVILVCMNYAHHLGIDIEHALKQKIEINRQRI